MREKEESEGGRERDDGKRWKEGRKERSRGTRIMRSQCDSLTNLLSLIRHTPAGGGERDERMMIKRDGGRNVALRKCERRRSNWGN